MYTMKESYIRLKQAAKYQRWQYRRLVARREYGNELCQSVPIIFGNSIPKAGSHLLSQVLLGLTELGPIIDTGCAAVNRDEANRTLPEEQTVEKIKRLKPGDIGYGKIHCKSPFIELLTQPSVATVFMYRDPRDLAISIIKYATNLHKGHLLHKHFTTVLTTDEERLKFVIAGSDNPDFQYPNLKTRYENYIGWIEQPVLAIRFEDMIEDRKNSLNRLLDFLAKKGFAPSVSREDAIDVLESAIQPKRSGTFRKGKPGEWRSVFSPATKALFRTHTGDLLQRLGYEKNMDW